MKIGSVVTTQLTAPGAGAAIQSGKLAPASIQGRVTVSDIDTDVSFCYEASDDGFATVGGMSVIQKVTSENSGVPYVVEVPNGFAQIRPVFTAETGGTGVKLDFETVFFTN